MVDCDDVNKPVEFLALATRIVQRWSCDSSRISSLVAAAPAVSVSTAKPSCSFLSTIALSCFIACEATRRTVNIIHFCHLIEGVKRFLWRNNLVIYLLHWGHVTSCSHYCQLRARVIRARPDCFWRLTCSCKLALPASCEGTVLAHCCSARRAAWAGERTAAAARRVSGGVPWRSSPAGRASVTTLWESRHGFLCGSTTHAT